ncbi:hypothetical protein [Legionella worsleiensis]|uniref:CDP-Glycerol:Poly(Glycerophosphate) glycerophosphotransferase n=1 Tax=Legionella worsleiensis TaxID=45076 RepID=A0A0W1A4E3_9GAMM|nr:hypothetical protein [Legionella worsleiensis]KTD75875.1 hypothetical protein Lwor_2441 [Legionella worsleiensis]STY32888.1 Uncharacterised protein [Legionella worsleiensis]
MKILSKIAHRLVHMKYHKKNIRPILLYVASFTEAPLIGILANQLIQKQESIIILLSEENKSLKARIKSFITSEKVQFIYSNNGYSCESFTKKDEIFFEKIKQKYITYNLDFNTLKALYCSQRMELIRSKSIIKQYSPKLLIVAEDGVSANAPLINAALEFKIPVLDVPYGYGSKLDLENALEQKQRNEELYNSESGAGLVVKEFYPQWVKKGAFEGSILLNPYFILAREELGISVSNPWTVHGGYATRLAAESKSMYAHYLNEGINANKIILTGTPYCDYLKAFIDCSKSIHNSAKKKNNRRSMLVCWPPSYHAERAHLCDFDSYQELTASVFNFLSKLEDITITLSLHPAVQTEFKSFVAGLNLNISEEYILNELPRHDIYISCFSSTIRWAIALGKPVVNYDFYKFNINEYKEVSSVLHVNEQNSFEQIVGRLINDDDYYEEVCSNQKKIAADWGVLDGSNINRIHALINQLTINEDVAALS